MARWIVLIGVWGWVAVASAQAPAAVGAACYQGSDCQTGVCEGQGCGAPGVCIDPRKRRCTRFHSRWCGCDGRTYVRPDGCALIRYAHRGACGGSQPMLAPPIDVPPTRPAVTVSAAPVDSTKQPVTINKLSQQPVPKRRPAHVRRITGAWDTVDLAPNGRWLAFWSRRYRQLNVYDVARRRVVRRYRFRSNADAGAIKWAPDSTHFVVFGANGGLLFDRRTRRPKRLLRFVNKGYAYDYRFVGPRTLIAHLRDWLPNDGISRFTWSPGWTRVHRQKLTARKWSHVLSRQKRTGAGKMIYARGKTKRATELVLIDVYSGATQVVARAPFGQWFGEARMGPRGNRVCYFVSNKQTRRLVCLDLKAGVSRVVEIGRRTGFPPYWSRAFSPDGRYLTYLKNAGYYPNAYRMVWVYDAVSRRRWPIAKLGSYSEFTMRTNSTVVFADGSQSTGSAWPGLAEVDVQTGKVRNLVGRARTEYTMLTPVPGRTDIFFVGRERGGGREFVLVDLRAKRRAGQALRARPWRSRR